MPIEWDSAPPPHTPKKLQKPQVRFGKATVNATPPPPGLVDSPVTDDESTLITPQPGILKRWTSRREVRTGSPDSDSSWRHHESYFPAYEPVYPTTTFGSGDSELIQAEVDAAGKPSFVKRLFTTKEPKIVQPPVRDVPDSYYPIYQPIYPTSIPTYPGAAVYALPPSEAQALTRQFGDSVALHYPDLPAFAEYVGKGDKGKVWSSGSASGWSGYGWDHSGAGFADGMVKGEVIKGDGAGKGGGGGAKKKKGKGGEGGEGGDGGQTDGEGEGEGGEGGDEAVDEEGADAAAPAEGGGKKKKKGKK